jgi:hypothetical protein
MFGALLMHHPQTFLMERKRYLIKESLSLIVIVDLISRIGILSTSKQGKKLSQ